MSKLLYRVDEAAYVLAISRRQVYRLIEEGELSTHNDAPGKKGVRVIAASIEAYVQKYQEKSK